MVPLIDIPHRVAGPASDVSFRHAGFGASVVLSPIGSARLGSRLDLTNEILRAGEETVLDQNAADDHHRMRSKNIDGVRDGQQAGVEGADHRVVVVRQHAVETHLVFDPFIAAEGNGVLAFMLLSPIRSSKCHTGFGAKPSCCSKLSAIWTASRSIGR